MFTPVPCRGLLLVCPCVPRELYGRESIKHNLVGDKLRHSHLTNDLNERNKFPSHARTIHFFTERLNQILIMLYLSLGWRLR